MKIKNAHIKNLTARAGTYIVDGPVFNVSSLTDWAGVSTTGSPALHEGKYLEFTGAEYLTTNTIDNTTLTNNDTTYEFWLRITSGHSGCLLAKYDTGGYQVSAVETDGNKIIPGYWYGSGTVHDDNNPTFTNGVWQHYAVTYTSAGTIKTYYNGTLVHTGTFSPEVSPRDYGAPYTLFKLFAFEPTGFGYNGAWAGDFGEFRYYSRVLTEDEVHQNYIATSSRWAQAYFDIGYAKYNIGYKNDIFSTKPHNRTKIRRR